MADTKISVLPASTTPLAGTEVLPIVQSSFTKQVSVANLTAGRSFDALGMTLTSTDAGATAAPILDLYRDSASPAASDTLGEIKFNGEDSAGNKQAYGLIHASILSPTSTAEQGQLHFETATAGALTEKMIIGTSNLVINEIGSVFNVRIEGDTDANLFYTDATNSRVGIGTISPAEKLDVVGNIKSSADLLVGANLLVGVTSAIASGSTIFNSGAARQVLTIKGDTSGSYTQGIWSATATGDNLFTYFGTETSLSVRGAITYNRTGGLTVYGTTSDYRAKDIIGPVLDSGAVIDSVPVYMGKMKGATQERPMFIAHETPAYAHTGEKDDVDADGNPVYQQMDTSVLVPVMWAEIQSLRKRLAALEAK
jgi:hypothetical protein